MNETKLNNKVPLISGPYYKEILREMRTIGIVFAAIQLLFGLVGEIGGSAGVIFSAMTGGIIKRDIFIIYFLVAAMNFHKGHLSRGSWDFRGSLPVAKKTMAATHLLATLTYAAIIFFAHYVGVAIGEIIIRIPGIRISSIPPAFGASALSMIKNCLTGLLLYSGMMVLGSVIANMFSLIVAAFVIIELPGLLKNVIGSLSVGGSNLRAAFLPIGTRGHEAIDWIELVIGAVIVLILGVIAYSNARAETYGKPARKNWIHIAVGIGLAMVTGLGVLSIGLSQIVRAIGSSFSETSGFETKDYIIICAVALILMLIVYTVYMWITLRSFKKACKRIAFLPIAAALMALVIPFAMLANAKWKKADFRASNIDYVTILDGTLENPDQDYMLLLYDDYSAIRGRTGAERVKLNDPEMIKLVSEEAETVRKSMMTTSSIDNAIASMIIGMGYTPSIELTLKDGTTWTLPINRSFVATYVAPYALKNAEFTEKLAGMDRFKGARVFSDLGREFDKTLLEELEALSPADRAQIFCSSTTAIAAVTEMTDGNYNLGAVMDMLNNRGTVFGTVTIVSPTYDHSINVNITDKLPKTAALYVKLVNERTRNWKDFDELTRRLESGEFGSFSAMVTSANNSIGFLITPHDKTQNPAYIEKSLEAARILANAMKRDTDVRDTKHLVCLDMEQFTLGSGRPDDGESSYTNDIIRESKQIFITLTDSELRLIEDVFFNGKWEQYPDEYYNEY